MLGIKVTPLNFLLTRESIPFGLRQLCCIPQQLQGQYIINTQNQCAQNIQPAYTEQQIKWK